MCACVFIVTKFTNTCTTELLSFAKYGCMNRFHCSHYCWCCYRHTTYTLMYSHTASQNVSKCIDTLNFVYAWQCVLYNQHASGGTTQRNTTQNSYCDRLCYFSSSSFFVEIQVTIQYSFHLQFNTFDFSFMVLFAICQQNSSSLFIFFFQHLFDSRLWLIWSTLKRRLNSKYNANI